MEIGTTFAPILRSEGGAVLSRTAFRRARLGAGLLLLAAMCAIFVAIAVRAPDPVMKSAVASVEEDALPRYRARIASTGPSTTTDARAEAGDAPEHPSASDAQARFRVAVTAPLSDGLPSANVWWREPGAAWSGPLQTDQAGRVTVPMGSSPSLEILCRADGFCPASTSFKPRALAGELVVELRESGTLVGRVVDESADAVSSPVTVVALDSRRATDRWTGRDLEDPSVVSARTDRTGRFVLHGVPHDDESMIFAISETWISDFVRATPSSGHDPVEITAYPLLMSRVRVRDPRWQHGDPIVRSAVRPWVWCDFNTDGVTRPVQPKWFALRSLFGAQLDSPESPGIELSDDGFIITTLRRGSIRHASVAGRVRGSVPGYFPIDAEVPLVPLESGRIRVATIDLERTPDFAEPRGSVRVCFRADTVGDDMLALLAAANLTTAGLQVLLIPEVTRDDSVRAYSAPGSDQWAAEGTLVRSVPVGRYRVELINRTPARFPTAGVVVDVRADATTDVAIDIPPIGGIVLDTGGIDVDSRTSSTLTLRTPIEVAGKSGAVGVFTWPLVGERLWIPLLPPGEYTLSGNIGRYKLDPTRVVVVQGRVAVVPVHRERPPR